MATGLAEAEIKVIIQDYIDDKVVYRDSCIARHKEVESMKDDIRCIRDKLAKFTYILFGVLVSIITTLITVIIKWV